MQVKKNWVIALNSGGLDSSILLAYLHDLEYQVKSIFVDYGQVSRKKEKEAAKAIAKQYGTEFHEEKIRLNIWQSQDFLSNPSTPQPSLTLRNFVLFSIAAVYCDANSIPNIALAWDGMEVGHILRSPVFDSHKRFAQALCRAFDEGSRLGWDGGYSLRCILPFVNKSKLEIMQIGKDLGVDFTKTWSCYAATKKPCMQCNACNIRSKFQSQIGIPYS